MHRDKKEGRALVNLECNLSAIQCLTLSGSFSC